MKSLLRALVSLSLVSVFLLLSDLDNRKQGRNNSDKQGRKFTMALVHYVDSPNSEDCEEGIRAALAAGGLKENKDFELRVYNAQGDISVLNSIAGTLSSTQWDLVFALSTPTAQVLAEKLSGQKIVFTNVGDPLIAGLGKTFEDHRPDVTGISTMSDFEGMIALVKAIQPGIRIIGTVFAPGEINSVAYRDRLGMAAEAGGLRLVSAAAASPGEVMDAANSLASKKIEAFCQISDNLTGSSGASIIRIASDRKIPFFGFVSSVLSQGALAICARDYRQAGYDAGLSALEVLDGTAPGSIPFKLVSKTIYAVNMKRAGELKIPIDTTITGIFPGLLLK